MNWRINKVLVYEEDDSENIIHHNYIKICKNQEKEVGKRNRKQQKKEK